jgi:hypothetical protein
VGTNISTKQLLYNEWVKKIAPSVIHESFTFIDDNFNAQLIGDFVETMKDGEYSFDNFTSAVRNLEIANRLHLKSKLLTPEEIAQRAAEEKAKTDVEEQNALIKTWLSEHAPRALLTSQGILDPDDARKVANYVERNNAGVFTIESLNDAVIALSSSLTWLSPDPAERQLRNYTPKPAPPRKLSEQAQLDAGLKIQRLKGHDLDGNFKNPAEAIRTVAQKLTRNVEDPEQVAAMQIQIQDRRGRIDRAKVEEMRSQVLKDRTTGKTNWAETRKLWNRFADKCERDKNKI